METQPHHHKAPTVRTIELDLLSQQTSIAAPLHGAATWLSHGIQIEEAGIILTRDRKAVGLHSTERHRLALARRAECLSTEIQLFLSEAQTFLGGAIVNADTADNADNMEDGTHDPAEQGLLRMLNMAFTAELHLLLICILTVILIDMVGIVQVDKFTANI